MQNVKDFGAVGNGIVKDTSAIQKAIDAGGMVLIPPGTYLCGTLYLKSNGGLHLEPGAVLLASPDKEDYNADDFCVQNPVFKGEYASGAHFIVAVEEHDITIEGSGRIDGNRQAFYGDKSQPGVGRCDEKFDRNEIVNGWRPGQMVFLCECTNIHIDNVQMYNAPYWTCFLHGCEQVQVRGIRILNDQRTFNGDGLDLDCCRFVTVSDCIIDSGDDCITLRCDVNRLKNKKACEFVTVTNCVLHTNCNAIRIGVGAGEIRCATFSNCIIHDANMGVMICSKYSQNSADIHDIQFENMRIDSFIPFEILTNAWGKEMGPTTKPVHDISFHHIRGSGCSSCRFIGFEPGDIRDVSVRDVLLDWTDGGKPDSARDSFTENGWGPCPDAAMYLECVENMELDSVRIRWQTQDPAWKYGFRAERCYGLAVTRSDFGRESKNLPEKAK